MIKTKLPLHINNLEEAKAYLKSLYDNGEAYHPDDSVEGVNWGDDGPTDEQAIQMNTLMDEIFALAKGTSFDPSEYISELDPDYVKERAREIGSHLIPDQFILGNGPIFKGYHNPNSIWAGFNIPYFTKDVANDIIQYLNIEHLAPLYTWNGDEIKIYHLFQPPTFIVPVLVLIDGNMIPLYSFDNW